MVWGDKHGLSLAVSVGQDFRGAEGTSSSFYLRPPPLAQGPNRHQALGPCPPGLNPYHLSQLPSCFAGVAQGRRQPGGLGSQTHALVMALPVPAARGE